MKKSLFIALAAAGMLTACSSHDDLTEGNGGKVDASVSLQDQIKLGVSTGSIKAMTRGTGTIGSTEVAANKWAGQDLWIYMMQKGTVIPATFSYKDNDNQPTQEFAIFENKKVTAPIGETSGVVSDNDVRYFPLAGQYDFWGYRIDDAASMTSGAPAAKYVTANGTEDKENAVKVIVPFEIDGSQDVMVGKADIQDKEKALVGDNYYSSYAARRGVQPNITFQHLLTRFTFTVVAGNESTAGYKKVTNTTTDLKASDTQKAAKVEGIAIASQTKGNLVVAYNQPKEGESAPELIEWATESNPVVKLNLKQRKATPEEGKELDNTQLEDLKAVSLTGSIKESNVIGDDESTTTVKSFEATPINIGEALLVKAGQTEYPLYLTISQEINTTQNGDLKKMLQTLKTTIKASDIKVVDSEAQPTTFEAGKSYNIVIKVYGYERVEITATLIPWKDGGKIDKDTDTETDKDWSVEK